MAKKEALKECIPRIRINRCDEPGSRSPIFSREGKKLIGRTKSVAKRLEKGADPGKIL